MGAVATRTIYLSAAIAIAITGHTNDSEYRCTYYYYGRDHGCNRRMCFAHKSKDYYYRRDEYSSDPCLCVECSHEMRKCTPMKICIPVTMLIVFLVISLIMFLVFKKNTSDMNDNFNNWN